MIVAVTGANGYIGQEVIRQLSKKESIEILSLDVDDWDIRLPLSICNPQVDVVIHLAGLVKVSESVARPTAYYYTNVVGTKNVIDAFPNAKMIFASTGAAYDPTSPYARSKLMAEDIVQELCSDYTIFRFFNVGGGKPTNPEGLYAATQNAIESKIFTIFGNDYDTADGTCVRDYVHVEDLCAALVAAVGQPGSKTIEPIGSGQSYTVKEYVDAWLQVNGTLFNIEFGERRPGDNEKSEVPFVSRFMVPTKTIYDIVRI